jgi:GTP-binding protein Era
MKSGFVAILGRPNVGKSTLINALLSKKVSIVTPRAQTTRDDVMGVYNEKDLQIVFVDTPGLFEGKEALDAHMNKEARSAMKGAEVLVYLLDCSCPDFAEDDKIIGTLDKKIPLILVLNKIDLVTLTIATEAEKHFKTAFPKAEILQMSALTNYGLKELKEAVVAHLSEGPAYYPTDALTDKDPSFTAKEVVREELLHFLKEEVPHQCAVVIDEYKEKDGAAIIHGTVYVEKETQVGIVIGKAGTMIKKISMSARRELERMWGKHVTLVLLVRYEPDWRNNPNKLQKLGYGESKGDDE